MSGEYARDFDQWDSSGNFKVMNVDKCYPIFSTKFKQNKIASLEQGRVVGDTIEMVEIVIAGDRSQSWYGKVNDDHRKRWATLYKAWQTGQEAPVEGTPLEQWPLITTSFLHELKSLGIRSVETLAGLSDTQIQSFRGGLGWRTKAAEFLNRDGTPAERMVRSLQERIAQLEGKVTPTADVTPVAAPVAPQAAPVDLAAIVAQAVALAVAALPGAAVSAVKPKKELSEKKKAAMANMVAARMAKRAAKAASAVGA